MGPEDRIEFGTQLAMLGEAFNEPVAAARARAYWLALEDLPLPAVRHAVARALRESRFFPRPAELREYAGAGVPDAGLVNALISKHVGTIGGDHTAPRDVFLRLVVERLGGIRRASDMSAPDRLRLLERILPAVTTACAARGIPMPTEAAAALADTPRRLALVHGSRDLEPGGAGC